MSWQHRAQLILQGPLELISPRELSHIEARGTVLSIPTLISIGCRPPGAWGHDIGSSNSLLQKEIFIDEALLGDVSTQKPQLLT